MTAGKIGSFSSFEPICDTSGISFVTAISYPDYTIKLLLSEICNSEQSTLNLWCFVWFGDSVFCLIYSSNITSRGPSTSLRIFDIFIILRQGYGLTAR